MVNPIAYAKSHPFITGTVVIGGAIVTYLIFAGNDGTETIETAPGDYSSVGTGMAIQAAQNEILVRGKEIDAALTAELERLAVEKELGMLASNVALATIESGEYVAGLEAEASAQQSSLLAELEGMRITSETEREAIDADRDVQLQQITSGVLRDITQIQSTTALQSQHISASSGVQMAQIYAAAQAQAAAQETRRAIGVAEASQQTTIGIPGLFSLSW